MDIEAACSHTKILHELPIRFKAATAKPRLCKKLLSNAAHVGRIKCAKSKEQCSVLKYIVFMTMASIKVSA